MTASHLNRLLVAVAAGGMAIGVRLVAAPLVRVVLPARVGVPPAATVRVPAVRSDSLAGALVGRNPFRLTRRPATVPYDAARPAQPAMPPAPKPVLTLVGVVWDKGRDPSALIDGLPGVDGPRPVRRGDVIGGLRVKGINPDRVVISGLDTTWTLMVKEPWK